MWPNNAMNLTDRISILEYCNREFPGGAAIEIGVAGGHFTKQILASWPNLKTLLCVDAWRHFDVGYDDSCNLSDAEQEERYQRFLLDMKDDKRVIPLRGLSLDAASEFYTYYDFEPSFIYLDANHSEEHAYADAVAWWPKLKSGGIFSGHDYAPGNGKGYGVRAAIDRFAKERDLTVFSTTQEYCRPSGVYGAGWEGCSFVIRKP
jgi:hypothetical protein